MYSYRITLNSTSNHSILHAKYFDCVCNSFYHTTTPVERHWIRHCRYFYFGWVRKTIRFNRRKKIGRARGYAHVRLCCFRCISTSNFNQWHEYSWIFRNRTMNEILRGFELHIEKKTAVQRKSFVCGATNGQICVAVKVKDTRVQTELWKSIWTSWFLCEAS